VRPAVFLDRDGTLVDELGFLARAEDLRLLSGAAEAVRRVNAAGLAAIVVTNQSGIARGLFGERELAAVHARLAQELARGGARLDDVLHCPHHPSEGVPPWRAHCECRKPAPGLVLAAARAHGLALASSWMIGDSLRDLECGARAGLAGGILVLTGKGPEELATLSAAERARTLVAPDVRAAVELVLARQGK
jgi:D-glycero-D-manno-heptose 1,7-bisphosphate phosphatase